MYGPYVGHFHKYTAAELKKASTAKGKVKFTMKPVVKLAKRNMKGGTEDYTISYTNDYIVKMFEDHGLPPPSYTQYTEQGKTKYFTECYLVVNTENLLLYNYKVSSLAIMFDGKGIFTTQCSISLFGKKKTVYVQTMEGKWVIRCYNESKDNITKFNRTKSNLKLISDQIPNFGENINKEQLQIGDVIYLDSSKTNPSYKLLKPLHNGGKRRLKTKSKK